MKELRVGVSNLAAVTMDTVFAEAAALVDGHADGGAEELRLSLEDVKFIDPYGLVGLWCVLRYLKRPHERTWTGPIRSAPILRPRRASRNTEFRGIVRVRLVLDWAVAERPDGV